MTGGSPLLCLTLALAGCAGREYQDHFFCGTSDLPREALPGPVPILIPGAIEAEAHHAGEGAQVVEEASASAGRQVRAQQFSRLVFWLRIPEPADYRIELAAAVAAGDEATVELQLDGRRHGEPRALTEEDEVQAVVDFGPLSLPDGDHALTVLISSRAPVSATVDWLRLDVDWSALGDDPQRLLGFGQEWQRRSQPRRALGYFQRAYQVAPGNPQVMAALALCEVELARWALAEAHLSEALRVGGAWVEQHRPQLTRILQEASARQRGNNSLIQR